MKKNLIHPTEDRVLIKPVEAAEKSAGGIYLPEEARENPQIGVVVAVGPASKDHPMPVSEGDKVLFAKYSGTHFRLADYGGEEYLILRSTDILATLG